MREEKKSVPPDEWIDAQAWVARTINDFRQPYLPGDWFDEEYKLSEADVPWTDIGGEG